MQSELRLLCASNSEIGGVELTTKLTKFYGDDRQCLRITSVFFRHGAPQPVLQKNLTVRRVTRHIRRIANRRGPPVAGGATHSVSLFLGGRCFL